MSCRLCFSMANDLLEIFGDEGKALKVSEIVTQHFWFQVTQNDPFSQHVCKHCWANVNDFHDFYCEIEKKQINCPPFVSSLGEQHPFETNFLISDKAEDAVIQDASVNAKCEVKTEDDNDFNFDFDGDEVVSAIKAETELKMSEDDLDDDDYMASDDGVEKDDSEDDEFVAPKPVKKKITRTRKIKTETVTIKKEKKVRVKDAATQEKLKAIADKCKKSNEWGDAQEENIKQLCKMECTICADTQFEKWLDMKKHYRVAHQIQGFVICSCCDGKFTKRFKILDHVVRKLNPEEFKCKICNKYYENRDSLGHHMGYHEPEESRPYKCEECFKTFTRRSQFLDHQIRHTPEAEKQFSCAECGKRFHTESMLNTHIKQRHTKQYKYSKMCELCGKTLKSMPLYEKHKEKVHFNVPQPMAQCHFCQKWYLLEGMKSHLKIYHQNKSESVRTCSICGMVANTIASLRMHMKRVHVERAQMLQCNVCDKSFKRALGLKEHYASHTGEDLYNCDYCSKTFKSNANKYKHQKGMHKAEWEQKQRDKVAKEASYVNQADNKLL